MNVNNQRAGWAGKAIAAFRKECGTDDECVLSDLLCDLMHWADRNEMDFDIELSRAETHYDEETRQ